MARLLNERSSGKSKDLTVFSFLTLSFDPPLVMFSIQQNADSYVPMVSSQVPAFPGLQSGLDVLIHVIVLKIKQILSFFSSL